MRTSGYVLGMIGVAIALAAYIFRFPLQIGMNGHYFEPWLLLKILGIVLLLLGIVLVVRASGQPTVSQ
ncbi:MAG TPA: hypothetical protein VEG30_17560 [Terriglobales bacterium]|nr:hypothetical protein [Terriglobales bacterium]